MNSIAVNVINKNRIRNTRDSGVLSNVKKALLLLLLLLIYCDTGIVVVSNVVVDAVASIHVGVYVDDNRNISSVMLLIIDANKDVRVVDELPVYIVSTTNKAIILDNEKEWSVICKCKTNSRRM
jgi:hypothetical protein